MDFPNDVDIDADADYSLSDDDYTMSYANHSSNHKVGFAFLTDSILIIFQITADDSVCYTLFFSYNSFVGLRGPRQLFRRRVRGRRRTGCHLR